MIGDLALILIVAGIVTLIFKKLKQPLVLGYIVAGFLVSPHMPYIPSVIMMENVEEWAEIGVMFTLFSLGLEFSFKKIVKMGAGPVIAALTIVTFMMLTGFSVGHAFGWSNVNCLFLGGMLAMSSTTIIYKAFDDLGLLQKKFASVVMSVLILEDILAIVMMVMLTAVATGNNPDSGEMIMSVLNIGFFLVLWFVVGIFAVPWFLRKFRPIMTSETLLVVSLGLCCMMAVFSKSVGFSEAFGAFVMGSILAETVEAEKIEHVISPVQNLFGAIFFVSVGMLVDPRVLVDYAAPILILVAVIIFGQALFGSVGYFLSGQPLRTAIRCGFSMAQIGEFAFIIASLGLSLGVIADFLYPVVVAVSVITTFLTPYMIRVAEPVCNVLESHMPKSVVLTINSLHSLGRKIKPVDVEEPHHGMMLWRRLLKSMAIITVVYSILSVTVILLMLSIFRNFMSSIMQTGWADAVTALITVVLISPFLRAIIMKKNKSEEWKALWRMNTRNHFTLLFTIVVRGAICLAMIFYVLAYLLHYNTAVIIIVALMLVVSMMLSRMVKKRSIMMERLFVRNLRSRDIAAQVKGRRRPLYADHLLDHDLHITDIVVPQDSLWAGQTMAELDLRRNYGIHVSSILRGERRINIPGADERIFPNDRLQVIGTDDKISVFNSSIAEAVHELNSDIENQEMVLRQITVTRSSHLNGKALRDSGLRDVHSVMVVGLETGENELTPISPDYVFETGDVIWVVGERDSEIFRG